MAVSHFDFMDVELGKASTIRSYSSRIIGEGDVYGDIFGVTVYRNGVAESLVGVTCVGYFIRPDGVTLIISGVVSGNTAYVELPPAAYAKSGCFSLAIKIRGAGKTDTVRIVDGTVAETTTGDMADPASSIPSVADLMAIIGRAETAAATINGLSVAATQILGTRYKIAVTKT